MYQTVRGKELSWEPKVTAQECQKLFLQEIEEDLIQGSLHHFHQQLVDQKRKGKGCAQDSNSSNLVGPRIFR